MKKHTAYLEAPSLFPSNKYLMEDASGRIYIVRAVHGRTTVTLKVQRWYHRAWVALRRKFSRLKLYRNRTI